MKIDPSQLEVRNNASAGRFEIQVDGYMAELDYRLKGRDMMITHTGVPPALEGQGVGSRLAQTALDFARENSYHVISLCSFVDAYIRRHPEYKSLLDL